MFCPQCKAEYRPGFTTCIDCEVALMPSLPLAEDTSAASNAKGPLVPLWEGDNLAIHTSLIEGLGAAKIPYLSEPLSVYPGIRRADLFPIQPLTRFGYKVGVLSSHFPAAEEILENLLEQEPQDMALPEEFDSPDVPRSPAESGEEPNSEIWAGKDNNFAAFLQDALRENQIGLRIDTFSGEARILVGSSDVARAREIVRELTEAAPPK